MPIFIGILLGMWSGGLIMISCSTSEYYEGAVRSSTHTIVRSSSTRRGVFHSPNWPDKYPPNSRYLLIFVGTQSEQVQLQFQQFNVEGLSALCKKDFVDIYLDINQPTLLLHSIANITRQLIRAPLLGRYCGHDLDYVPNTLVSRYNMLVLDFFSDVNTQRSYNQDNHMGKLGFKGNFTFRKNRMKVHFKSPSRPTTKPSAPFPHSFSSCLYTISANKTREGIIQSPTFPGLPPYPLSCVYQFESDDDQDRVQLDFTDFKLFQMFDSCPLEHMRIFSGPGSRQVVLRETCGSKAPFHVTSVGSSLLLEFQVSSDRTFLKQQHQPHSSVKRYQRSLQSRGFSAHFRFYRDISLHQITLPHLIPGTECDQAIRSSPGKLSGQITVSEKFLARHTSRRSQQKQPVLCNLYFTGIHNSQVMEVVLLNFTFVNLPTTSYQKCTGASISLRSSTFKILDIVKRQRRILLNNKSHTREICGIKRYYQYKAVSPVTVLQVKIRKVISKNLIPTGFQINYRFVRDYGITGRMLTLGKCHFVYRSHDNLPSQNNEGLINSPFYNNFYPNNAHCQYDLIANADEIIRIVFIDFQTSEDISPDLMNQHDMHMACRQDYLSISEIVRHSNQQIVMNVTERYCGDSLPGLLVSQPDSMGFTLIFKTDNNKTGPGFLAEYQFLKKTPLFKNSCGSNVTLLDNHGVISSPHYPKRYPANLICEWHLHSPYHQDRVILLFSHFKIEGNAKSCSNAVLRIYEASNVKARLELCGIDPKITAYVSTHNFIRIRFLTDKRSTGADGFQILWTRSMGRLSNGSCPSNGFLCHFSGHCIHRNLTCNSEYNCGSFINISGSVIFDKSDETVACPQRPDLSHLYFGLAIVAGIFMLLFCIILVFHRKNSRLLDLDHPGSSPPHSLLAGPDKSVALFKQSLLQPVPEPPPQPQPQQPPSCYFYYSSVNPHSVIQNPHLDDEEGEEQGRTEDPDPFRVLDHHHHHLPGPTSLCWDRESAHYDDDDNGGGATMVLSSRSEQLQKVSMV